MEQLPSTDPIDRQARPAGDEPATASLYVHIPWCLSKCPYCDFNSHAARTWPEAEYADAIVRELRHRSRERGFSGRRFATVFFGGGTPSLFEPRTIGRILDRVAEDPGLEAGAEITLEANPGTVNEGRLRDFRSVGVNRLSYGIQSFQPDLLLALGRRHSVDDSRGALVAARRAGFANLSLDLIFAVPGQSIESCEADLDEAVSFETEHVSAYALTFEPGTAFHRDRSAGRVRQAPEDLEVAMFELVRARLSAAGLPAYEISNFARPGFEARHNQAYWRGVPYLGLGAGAHSFAPGDGRPPGAGFGCRRENVRDPGRWMAAVVESGSGVVETEELGRREAMGETCWLSLRETRGLDPAAFRTRFGEDFATAFPHVPDLVADGLVAWQQGRLVLTARGLLLADAVFSTFL
ncbi:radical SAM family heme chaperone HemW [bacterium]|nr:radical SAM family heme chaperone HemW [bacterium]